MSEIPEDIKREAEWLCPDVFFTGGDIYQARMATIKAIAQAILAERTRSNEDPDKYCMTDNGPLLWKEIAQGYLDELEWHRSSLNPKWKEVRENERERCAKIAEDRFTKDSVLKTAKGEPYVTGSAAIYAGNQIAAAIRGTSST